jgi:hypothetical protein
MNKEKQLFRNKVYTGIIVCLVLIGALCLRVHTFYLPHNHGDQLFFLGLAMKMDSMGLKGYNLKGIDMVANEEFLAMVPAAPGQKGSLLTSLEQDNVFYYSREIVSNMPPAFSFLIMMSHRFLKPQEMYVSVTRNLGPYAVLLRPKGYFNAQFYAVWINCFFSLALIAATFFLGRLLFDEKTGLWASLLIAASAVDIMTSQRLWTDEMAAFFITLAILLYWSGRKRKNPVFFACSGISAGIAALTKQSGVFVVFILIIFDFLSRCLENKKLSLRFLFTKESALVGVLALLVCGFWYIKIASLYGAPWYMPYQKGIEQTASWFMFLAKRPRYGQLYYFVYLLPLFALFYFEAVITVVKKIFSFERLLCITWFFVFISLLLLANGKEERYMLPAYPVIAIFSALGIERLRQKYNSAYHLGDILAVAFIAVSAMWSIGLGLSAVFKNMPTVLAF